MADAAMRRSTRDGRGNVAAGALRFDVYVEHKYHEDECSDRKSERCSSMVRRVGRVELPVATVYGRWTGAVEVFRVLPDQGARAAAARAEAGFRLQAAARARAAGVSAGGERGEGAAVARWAQAPGPRSAARTTSRRDGQRAPAGPGWYLRWFG